MRLINEVSVYIPCADESNPLTVIKDIPGRSQAVHLVRQSRKLAPKRLEKLMDPLYARLDKHFAKAIEVNANLSSQYSTKVPAEKLSSKDGQSTQPQSFSNRVKIPESSSADIDSTTSQKLPHDLSSAVTIRELIGHETSINKSSKRISIHTSSNTTISNSNTFDTPTATKTVSSTECDCDEETLIELEKSDYQITGCDDSRNDWDGTDTTLHMSEDDSSAAVEYRKIKDNDRDISTLSFRADDATYAVTQLRRQCKLYILKMMS